MTMGLHNPIMFLLAVSISFAGILAVAETDENGTQPVYESLFANPAGDDPRRPSSWIHRSEAETNNHHPEAFFDADAAILPVAVGANRTRHYSIAAKSFLWRDPARRRSVPVRIYYPSKRTEERFPVIVFSHGLGGSIDRCSYLGSAWAARGFVAVMLQHPGSDENVWKGKLLRIRGELEEAYRYNWSGRTRALDIRFALDQLDIMTEQGNWLASIMDLDRIGVGGYDLGCLAALLVSGQHPPDHGPSLYDPRVAAVLAMSPPVNRPATNFRDVYASISIPAFFITGTEDDGIIGSTKAHQRRIPFDSITSGDRYLVTLRGGDHRVYGGRFLAIGADTDKSFQAVIARASSCFWQATLREETQAQAALNGYGLNSLLGGMARLERKHRPADQPEDRAIEDVADDEPVKIEEKPLPQARRDVEPRFPLTRIYRAVLSRNGT